MKKKTGIAAIAIIAVLAIAGIFAYQIDRDNKNNPFSIGENEIQIEETFPEPGELMPGTSYTKQVQVSNTDSVPCYVRVFAEFDDSSVADYVSLDINQTDWVKEADGYYYYKVPVQPGEKTSELFKHFTISADAAEKQLDQPFDIIVSAESVQSEGFKTYTEAFESING